MPSSRQRLKVFISYVGAERELAGQIARALRQKGDQVLSDSPIQDGHYPFADRARLIRQADIFLFLASTSSFDDKWAQREFEVAVQSHPRSRILPIAPDRSDWRLLPHYLRPFQLLTIDRGDVSVILSAIDAMRPVKTVSLAFAILTTLATAALAASTLMWTWSTDRPASDPRVIELLGTEVNRQAETAFFKTAVRIPEEHRVGNIERPSPPIIIGSWKIREDAEDKKRHFIHLPSVPLSQAEFIEKLSEACAHSLLLYVHGYNNEPQDASAPLANRLGYKLSRNSSFVPMAVSR